MRMLAVVGKQEHGKDTVNKLIKEISKQEVVHLSISKIIKKQAYDLLDLSTEEEQNIFDHCLKNHIKYQGVDVGKLLIEIGNEHRSKDEEFYVKELLKEVDKYVGRDDVLIVVSNLIYKLEEEKLREYCGEQDIDLSICLVMRHLTGKNRRVNTNEIDDIKADVVLRNFHDIEDLRYQIECMLK